MIDLGLPSLAFFDLDDCYFHYFVHDLAVACTNLRKAGIETEGAVDADSLEGHLIICYASALGFSAEEEAGLRAALPEFVKYRAALVSERNLWRLKTQDMAYVELPSTSE